MDANQPESRVSIRVPPTTEPGQVADFVSVWHTPNLFTLDFVVLRQPPRDVVDADTGESYSELNTVVTARVRLSPEQVWPLMDALQKQGEMWLAETGRHEPPESWLGRSTTVTPGNNQASPGAEAEEEDHDDAP